jgi:hypothetical protein
MYPLVVAAYRGGIVRVGNGVGGDMSIIGGIAYIAEH